MPDSMSMFRLMGLPDFQSGDDLAQNIIDTLSIQNQRLQQGDILVIAHKVVSKTEGACVYLADVTPSKEAIELAKTVNKDPRKVEVILSQSNRIVRAMKRPDQQEGVLIAEHKKGYICANAAVDESNADHPGQLILLPEDPDKSANALCQRLEAHFQCELGVVISDTFGRPWRLGQTNVAIGLANVPGVMHMQGEVDAFGRPLSVTAPAFADELAAASGLLMAKSAKSPVILFRGLDWPKTQSSSRDLIRSHNEDLFR
ncbi:coenzyme F420-0:L-glutamate ligase [Marinomonas posidonica]|uniref:F420-dependent oxidoreductase n=1 Tax=Marinomonas posidonica (strain CECT 7376 / NCIMB 14433 / IVIA-Po-181) TaxID=491952 RepID=F6CXN6_MARPP|nr:coenzyme F420-0:L-glutamate ligase [Marinomonas posidonica]AEF53349.1 F420-dependent oxidoreductase [Marinomonas posidonica IVIA-Po-181]